MSIADEGAKSNVYHEKSAGKKMEKEKGKLVLSGYDLPRITRPPSHLPTFHPSPERSAMIAGPRTPTPLIE